MSGCLWGRLSACGGVSRRQSEGGLTVRRSVTRCPTKSQSGFALLFVFVLAALVAVSLYLELPRVAFEAQRNKEQLLIDRGEQYSLAVRRFYMKNGRYPANMEELEHLNNIRFLRRQYVDPMTGKKDWRLIHVGPGGYLTDSLVQPPNQNPLGNNNQNGALGASGATGSTGTTATSGLNFGQSGPGQNASNQLTNPLGSQSAADAQQPPAPSVAAVRRPSDRGPLGGQPGQPGQPGLAPVDPNDPNAQNQNQPQDNGMPALQPGGVPVSQDNPQQQGALQQPGGMQQQVQPGVPVTPGQPGGPGAMPGQPMSAPGQAGAANSGDSVANNIMNGLTHANPNGATAGMGIQNNQNGQNQQLGGTPGIAGVASKFNGESIKRYNDQTNYKKWEFIFDLNKFRQQQMGLQSNTTPAANTLGGPGSQNGPGGQIGGSNQIGPGNQMGPGNQIGRHRAGNQIGPGNQNPQGP